MFDEDIVRNEGPGQRSESYEWRIIWRCARSLGILGINGDRRHLRPFGAHRSSCTLNLVYRDKDCAPLEEDEGCRRRGVGRGGRGEEKEEEV